MMGEDYGEIYWGWYNNEIYLASLLQRNIFGLRRRNNELIELTNFVAALRVTCGASAPEGGSYLG